SRPRVTPSSHALTRASRSAAVGERGSPVPVTAGAVQEVDCVTAGDNAISPNRSGNDEATSIPRSAMISKTTNVAATPQTIATNAIACRTRDTNGRAAGGAIFGCRHYTPPSRRGLRDRHPAGPAYLHCRRVHSRRRAALVARVALVSAVRAPADARSQGGHHRSARRIPPAADAPGVDGGGRAERFVADRGAGRDDDAHASWSPRVGTRHPCVLPGRRRIRSGHHDAEIRAGITAAATRRVARRLVGEHLADRADAHRIARPRSAARRAADVAVSGRRRD